jgi:hypothetical protein
MKFLATTLLSFLLISNLNAIEWALWESYEHICKVLGYPPQDSSYNLLSLIAIALFLYFFLNSQR